MQIQFFACCLSALCLAGCWKKQSPPSFSQIELVFENNREGVRAEQENLLSLLEGQLGLQAKIHARWLKSAERAEVQLALTESTPVENGLIVYVGYSNSSLISEFAQKFTQTKFAVTDVNLPEQSNLWQVQYDDERIGRSIVQEIFSRKLAAPAHIAAIWGGESKNIDAIRTGIKSAGKAQNLKVDWFDNLNHPIWGDLRSARSEANKAIRGGARVIVMAAADADVEITNLSPKHRISTVFIDGPAKEYCLKFEKQISRDLAKLILRILSDKAAEHSAIGEVLTREGKKCYADLR